MTDNPNFIARNADGSPLQSSYTSVANSVLIPPGTPPTVASPFVGGTDLVIDFVGITINLATAQSALHTGYLFFEFSPDEGVHWDVSVPIFYTSDVPFVPYPLRKVLPWFRVRYVPNDDHLTEFRLTVLYHRLAPEIITRLLNQEILLGEPVKVVRAMMMAENLAGDKGDNLVASPAGLLVDIAGDNLIPSKYDDLVLSYSGDQLASVVYKLAGVTVATLTLGYTGANLTSVTRT